MNNPLVLQDADAQTNMCGTTRALFKFFFFAGSISKRMCVFFRRDAQDFLLNRNGALFKTKNFAGTKNGKFCLFSLNMIWKYNFLLAAAARSTLLSFFRVVCMVRARLLGAD